MGSRSFRLLFLGGVLGAAGLQAQIVARGWIANEVTGSNAGLGGVFMAFGVMMLVSTPLGGVAADRYQKRSILIGVEVVLLLSAAWIGLAITFDFIEYWMLVVAAGLHGVCLAFFIPSRMALNGEIVVPALMMNAVVLSQVGLNLARIIGPALAAVLISIPWVGTAGTYYVAGLVGVLAATAFILLGRPAGRRPGRSTSVLTEYVDTLGYVRRNRQVGWLLIVSFVVTMIGYPFVAFLPRYATEILDVGAGGYGALAAASAVGAVVVGWLIAGCDGYASAWRIQVLAGFGFGAGLVAMGTVHHFVAGIAALLLVGAASAAFQSMNNSLALVLSDHEHHGRIQSILTLAIAGFGIAALPLGALADQLGLGVTLVLMGAAVAVAVAAYSLLSRALMHGAVERDMPRGDAERSQRYPDHYSTGLPSKE